MARNMHSHWDPSSEKNASKHHCFLLSEKVSVTPCVAALQSQDVAVFRWMSYAVWAISTVQIHAYWNAILVWNLTLFYDLCTLFNIVYISSFVVGGCPIFHFHNGNTEVRQFEKLVHAAFLWEHAFRLALSWVLKCKSVFNNVNLLCLNVSSYMFIVMLSRSTLIYGFCFRCHMCTCFLDILMA